MAFTNASDVLVSTLGKRTFEIHQDNRKPQKKRKKEAQYEYTPLGDIYAGTSKPGRKKFYVWGILLSYTEWKATSGSDWYMNMNICDESCNDMAVRLFFNRQSYPTPPKFPPFGSVVRLHRVWVDTYNGKMWLIYKQAISALTVYSDKPGEEVSFLWQSSDFPTFIDNDKKRLNVLRTWAKNQGGLVSEERHNDEQSDYLKKLEEITEGVSCDVLVKILDIQNEDKKQKVMIWDGTGDQENGDEAYGAVERPSVCW
eukprot:CAMPEP_0168535546 /NCGR_PEP_ID=MMETSP0405-20121227/18799_1 /TAXON_ID=498012 /ORGANISM="Trichosphaerium sp, Strain Am-I-7 wt" /LENGTH=255 /DNA_ID=CAMNT_0008562943 /DNA_START=11 /DNA_END=778 /DNA_ORIENTATION=-